MVVHAIYIEVDLEFMFYCSKIKNSRQFLLNRQEVTSSSCWKYTEYDNFDFHVYLDASEDRKSLLYSILA